MDRIRSMSVPEILVERILTDIASGKIRTGDRLPAQRDMAEQYKISNSSVREAMQTLQGMGIVEVRHPSGTFVVGELGQSAQAIKMISPKSSSQFKEAMEARCLVEIDINRLAAQRSTTEQINNLLEIISAMTSAIQAEEYDLYSGLDVQLHVSIAQAAINRFMMNYVLTLRTILGDFMKMVPGSATDLKHHKNLIDAIKDRDISRVDKATRALLLHVASIAVDQKLYTQEDYDKTAALLKVI